MDFVFLSIYIFGSNICPPYLTLESWSWDLFSFLVVYIFDFYFLCIHWVIVCALRLWYKWAKKGSVDTMAEAGWSSLHLAKLWEISNRFWASSKTTKYLFQTFLYVFFLRVKLNLMYVASWKLFLILMQELEILSTVGSIIYCKRCPTRPPFSCFFIYIMRT